MKHQLQNALGLLKAQVGMWGLDLTARQISLIRDYANLLAGYEQANVIGTKDPDLIVLDHLIDALSCLTVGHPSEAETFIDIGTGGGLPGIPLHLACPMTRLTLLEARARKVRFLDLVIRSLALSGVQTVSQRAETAGSEGHFRESFDVAVARAVAALPVVVEYCAPFVRSGGHIIAMKGDLGREEIMDGESAAAELGATLETVHKVNFHPELVQKERRLVVFRKTAATPKRFPRRVGLARKHPLGVVGRNDH